MNDLKPCPICASTAVFLRGGNVWKYVECMECDYKSKAVDDADVAVQAYNYRPIEDEALQHMAELDKIVGEQRLRIGALELDNAFIRAALANLLSTLYHADCHDELVNEISGKLIEAEEALL